MWDEIELKTSKGVGGKFSHHVLILNMLDYSFLSHKTATIEGLPEVESIQKKSRITSNDSLLGGRLQRQQSINDMAGNPQRRPVSSIFYHRKATVVFLLFSIITIMSNFGRKKRT